VRVGLFEYAYFSNARENRRHIGCSHFLSCSDPENEQFLLFRYPVFPAGMIILLIFLPQKPPQILHHLLGGKII